MGSRRPLQGSRGRCYLTYSISIAFIPVRANRLTQVKVFNCGQTVKSVNRIEPIATQIKPNEMASYARLAVYRCKSSNDILQICLLKVNPSDPVPLEAQID